MKGRLLREGRREECTKGREECMRKEARLYEGLS